MIPMNFEAFLESLFPAECQSCGCGLAAKEKNLCPTCFSHILEHRISFQESWQNPALPGIRSAWSAFHYQGKIRTLLQRIKFKREFYLLAPLCHAAAGLFQGIISDVYYDALIPMPVDWTRRLARHFNQSDILAGHLARWGHVPVQNQLLVKRSLSRPQSELSREMRRWNLFGAFKVPQPHRVAGKSFLLIDDIVTTGSSASEAARTLLNRGAKRVDLFTLARSVLISHPARPTV